MLLDDGLQFEFLGTELLLTTEVVHFLHGELLAACLVVLEFYSYFGFPTLNPLKKLPLLILKRFSLRLKILELTRVLLRQGGRLLMALVL